MRFGPRPFALAAACSVFLLAYGAHAQDTEATATALFDGARKLMSQHHYAEACPKLAQSERLAPNGGTLINLAECYEHMGKTASAWAAWSDAAARANAVGKADVERNALARAAALEPSLAKLTISVAQSSDVSGLQVKRDGVPVSPGELGSPLPVDPGSHVVEANAPKKKAWSATVEVAAKQVNASVTVSLADDVEAVQATPPSNPETSGATPTSTPTEPPPATSSWNGRKTVAVVVAGAGVVGVALGSVFGLIAKSDNDQALQPNNCRTPKLCNDYGLMLTRNANNAATESDIAFGAGAAALAAGVVIWLTAPHESRGVTGVRATPLITSSCGGLAVDGWW